MAKVIGTETSVPVKTLDTDGVIACCARITALLRDADVAQYVEIMQCRFERDVHEHLSVKFVTILRLRGATEREQVQTSKSVDWSQGGIDTISSRVVFDIVTILRFIGVEYSTLGARIAAIPLPRTSART